MGTKNSDRYRFKNALSAATNVDRITDCSGNDLIHVDDAIFSSIGATLDALEFRIGARAGMRMTASSTIAMLSRIGDHRPRGLPA